MAMDLPTTTIVVDVHEDLIGKKIYSISYPNGSCSIKIEKIVEETNYDFALTSYPYFNRSDS